MDRRITTRISAEIHEKLSERAHSQRKSEAVIVREALEAHLSQTESAYVELMRTGGLGIARGTPPDLLTNNAQMEGFGRNVSPRSARHGASRRRTRGR